MNLLVTGATGFVGRVLIDALASKAGDWNISGVVRDNSKVLHDRARPVFISQINGKTDWSNALLGCDCVIHLAARVHVMRDEVSDPLSAYREVNVAGTTHLAQQAAASGVRRFVFLSSIKVNGEVSQPGKPFTSNDLPAPKDPYGISKMEAEQELRKIATQTGMEVVIIRPPLVYGVGVGANFLALMKLVSLGIPLPFRKVEGLRSFVSVGNLVDLIIRCIESPKAANKTLLVSDGVDISVAQLINKIASASKRKSRMFSVPVFALRKMGELLGFGGQISRICDSLQVDINETRLLLDWAPQRKIEEVLDEMISESR
jgi:nucleoside-diphosphate-sugar epimerase